MSFFAATATAANKQTNKKKVAQSVKLVSAQNALKQSTKTLKFPYRYFNGF